MPKRQFDISNIYGAAQDIIDYERSYSERTAITSGRARGRARRAIQQFLSVVLSSPPSPGPGPGRPPSLPFRAPDAPPHVLLPELFGRTRKSCIITLF